MADLTITAANCVVDTAEPYVIDYSTWAGATITAGQVVYKDSTDSDALKLADADLSEAAADAYGVALVGASDGQPCPVLRRGLVTIGGTVAVGTRYVVSATAGAIAPETDLTTGDYDTTVGRATTTAKLAVDFTSFKNSTGATHA